MLFVDGPITFEPKLVIVAPFSVDFLIVFQGFLHLRFPVDTGYMTLGEPVAKSNGDFLGTANEEDLIRNSVASSFLEVIDLCENVKDY